MSECQRQDCAAVVKHASSSGASLLKGLTALAGRQVSPPSIKVAAGVAIPLLLAIAAMAVYGTGGTRYSYVHFAYVPVIVAAYFFGLRGGIVAGIAAGVAMGPLMPLDVVSGAYQSMPNWLTRTGFFVLIGALSGLAADILGRQLQAIRRQGLHDHSTGFPNRIQLLNNLGAIIGSAQPQNSRFALLSIGVANFEGIESTFGSECADQLHVSAGQRVQGLLPPDVQAYCIGGGIFAVPLHRPLDEVLSIGLQVAEALDQRFEVDGIPILCSGHAGLAQFPDDGADALSLLRAALSALRESEARNEHLRAYDGQLDDARRAKQRLLPDLQAALQSGSQITLHYQPIIDLSSGRCHRAEALVRWVHPKLGVIAPGQFIPAAEKTALMRPLTDLVLDRAVAQLRNWQQEGIDLQLSVNISVRDLEDEAFAERVRAVLFKYDVRSSRLELEVTEGALMTCPETAIANLHALRDLGVSIALDDFGTGQSSLSYLANLPADTLKLDRAFAKDIISHPRTAVAVKAAIEAAHTLGQKVVAEGLEDQDVATRFSGLSCDFGQGYLFSRPLPEGDFRMWLFNHQIGQLRSMRLSTSRAPGKKRGRSAR